MSLTLTLQLCLAFYLNVAIICRYIFFFADFGFLAFIILVLNFALLCLLASSLQLVNLYWY